MTELCEHYYEEVIVKCRKDATQMRRYLDKEIHPAFGSKPLREGCGSRGAAPGLPEA